MPITEIGQKEALMKIYSLKAQTMKGHPSLAENF